MCGQSIAYNIYATLGHTNPLFMGFLGYQNVNKEIIQPNIEKEQQTPKILYFWGFLYILKIYQTPSKQVTHRNVPIAEIAKAIGKDA